MPPDTTCPDCAIEMEEIEKTTFTGRRQVIDHGQALWEILSQANQQREKK